MLTENQLFLGMYIYGIHSRTERQLNLNYIFFFEIQISISNEITIINDLVRS